MSREIVLLGMYAASAVIWILTIINFIQSTRASKRARFGLRIIKQSPLRPINKIALLMEWNEPYASKEQLEWLIDTIEEIKAKEAKS